MAKRSVSLRTVDGTSGAAAAELFTDASTITRVVEIDIFLNAGTQSVFGIGFPAAKGTTPTTPVAVVSHDSRDSQVGSVKAAVAWGVGPTVPAAFLYRVNIPATAGAFVSITFPEGIVIQASSSLVVWNLAANSVADVTFVTTQRPVNAIMTDGV